MPSQLSAVWLFSCFVAAAPMLLWYVVCGVCAMRAQQPSTHRRCAMRAILFGDGAAARPVLMSMERNALGERQLCACGAPAYGPSYWQVRYVSFQGPPFLNPPDPTVGDVLAIVVDDSAAQFKELRGASQDAIEQFVTDALLQLSYVEQREDL
jgi:hypothetical protein